MYNKEKLFITVINNNKYILFITLNLLFMSKNQICVIYDFVERGRGLHNLPKQMSPLYEPPIPNSALNLFLLKLQRF